MVSFAFSILINIVAFPSRSRFAVKLICCMAFGSEYNACCLLKPIATSL